MKGRHFQFAEIAREAGTIRSGSAGPADLNRLAELCDGAPGPSREIDMRIALAISPDLRQLTGLGPHPGASTVGAPRYSSSTAAALTLMPDGHWIEFNPRGGGRIEIFGPDSMREIGWGRNSHFPLAASAAALRALGWLCGHCPEGWRMLDNCCSEAQA